MNGARPAVTLTCLGLALTLALACGSIVEAPERDRSSSSYIDRVDRVPSFWTEDIDGEVVIPFYVRDETFPADVDPDYLRGVVESAIAEWSAPLRAAGRRVTLPILRESVDLPPPERRVEVLYIRRGEGFLGVTQYDGELVRVELSVRAQNVDRFLTKRELQALTLHEFGHALGISQPGHSFNSADVMFGHNLATTWITLSDGDRTTLLELFPELMSDIRRSLSRLTPVPGDTPSARLDAICDRLDSLQDPEVRSRLFAGGVEESEFSTAMLDVGLALQARRVAPRAIEAALGRRPPRLSRAGGTTCVISAGNVPLITAADVVWSLLAGDRVVVKLSHRERVITRAFVELFADHAVADWWSRDDEVTERAVFGWADNLYAYGSDETVAAIRGRRNGSMQGFGHRVSFAWVPAATIHAADPSDLADLADRIATDVAMWDQEGCLSPHAVLVDATASSVARSAAGDLAGRLAKSFARLERVLPRGEVSFEARLASRALTLATEARMLSRSDVGAWSGEDGAWTVLLDPEPDTLLSPLGRTLRVVPVSGGASETATEAATETTPEAAPFAALAALAPYRGRVQSLGVSGAVGSDVLRLASSLGASRVCSLGRMQQPTASWFGEERASASEPPPIDVDVDVDMDVDMDVDVNDDGAWRWLRGEEAPPWFRMLS